MSYQLHNFASGDRLYASALNEMDAQIQANDRDKASVVYEWVTPALELVTGKLVIPRESYKNISFIANDYGAYAKTEVSGYTKLRISGHQWDVSYGYHLILFTDINSAVISVYTAESSGHHADVEIDVPANALFAYINGQPISGPIVCSALKKTDLGTLSREKADRIAKWVTLSPTLTRGQIKKDNGSADAHENGEYITVDVRGCARVQVSGYTWVTQYFSLCQFWDAGGALISAHYSDAGDSASATLVVDVPENASTLTVNGHIYAARPTAVGYRVYDIQNLYNDLKITGKKLITLGDSITALGTDTTGWVRYFLEKTECLLVANVAVDGAWLQDKSGTVYDGNPVFDGADNNVNNVLGNQVQKIINEAYEAPDIILIAIGTNGGISITQADMTAAYYGSGSTLIPLEEVDRTTCAGAYRWCLEKLHETYPNALIFWCAPIMGYQGSRSAENAMAYAESLRIATEYTGQMMIDTIRCGINGVREHDGENGQYLADGLHPNINGAKKIGYYNAAKVLPFLGSGFDLA